MYPAPNTNTPFSTDYRGLLVAKITAVHNPTTGPLAGRPVYEWIEQQISAIGGDQDVLSPRKGVYTSATQFDNCILDVNDNQIEVGQRVWARMKGMVTGCTIYETVVPPITNTASGSGGTGGTGCDLESVSFTVVTAVDLVACTVETKTITITGCNLSITIPE